MNFSLTLPRETVLKISRIENFILDGYKTPCKVEPMPGQRHPDKTTLSVYLPRTSMQRLKRLAAGRGVTVTAIIEAAVNEQIREVVLTPEDYEQIARETRAAMAGRTRARKA